MMCHMEHTERTGISLMILINLIRVKTIQFASLLNEYGCLFIYTSETGSTDFDSSLYLDIRFVTRC